MGKYVLVKTDSPNGGMYVNRSGMHKAYTKDILSARKFGSRDEAEMNACGNERAVPVSVIMERYGF